MLFSTDMETSLSDLLDYYRAKAVSVAARPDNIRWFG
jgi:hypothetical protein